MSLFVYSMDGCDSDVGAVVLQCCSACCYFICSVSLE
jgi:hypothetical protein